MASTKAAKGEAARQSQFSRQIKELPAGTIDVGLLRPNCCASTGTAGFFSRRDQPGFLLIPADFHQTALLGELVEENNEQALHLPRLMP